MHSLKRFGFWLFIAGIFFAFLPLIGLFLGAGIASLGDCRVHEGFPEPCVLLGIDLGNMLYGITGSGWYIFATIPIGGLAALIGLVLYFIALFSSKRTSSINE